MLLRSSHHPANDFDHMTIDWNVARWPSDWQDVFAERWAVRVADQRYDNTPLGDYRLVFRGVMDEAACDGVVLLCVDMPWSERERLQGEKDL